MANLFIVKFVTELGFAVMRRKASSWLGAYILGGPVGFVLSFFAEKYLGLLIEEGILQIDLGLYAAKVGMEKEDYREFAEKAYKKASKKVYSEDEKQKIREEYLAALRKFGAVGNGLR